MTSMIMVVHWSDKTILKLMFHSRRYPRSMSSISHKYCNVYTQMNAIESTIYAVATILFLAFLCNSPFKFLNTVKNIKLFSFITPHHFEYPHNVWAIEIKMFISFIIKIVVSYLYNIFSIQFNMIWFISWFSIFKHTYIFMWGLCCQKQVSQAGINNYIP